MLSGELSSGLDVTDHAAVEVLQEFVEMKGFITLSIKVEVVLHPLSTLRSKL
jgi:hypothetical protein